MQSWDTFFRNATAGAAPGQAYVSPPTLAEAPPHHVPLSAMTPALAGATLPAATGQVSEKVIDDHLAVQGIIRAYQVKKVVHF